MRAAPFKRGTGGDALTIITGRVDEAAAETANKMSDDQIVAKVRGYFPLRGDGPGAVVDVCGGNGGFSPGLILCGRDAPCGAPPAQIRAGLFVGTRLPPRVFDVEALPRPGMLDAGAGEIVVDELGHPVPRHRPPLAAP